jgi:hypothetical protein
MEPCPENWKPGCSCSCAALEPDDNCYIHGCPGISQCPYCGQMRGYQPCKRCGCNYGLGELQVDILYERVDEDGYLKWVVGVRKSGYYTLELQELSPPCDSHSDQTWKTIQRYFDDIPPSIAMAFANAIMSNEVSTIGIIKDK